VPPRFVPAVERPRPSSDPDLDAEFGFQRPELGKEKLAGTVGFYQHHVFLCYKGPEEWPSHVEATDSDRLPRLLTATIKARKSNLKKSVSISTSLAPFPCDCLIWCCGCGFGMLPVVLF
jgi:hypothetical protein